MANDPKSRSIALSGDTTEQPSNKGAVKLVSPQTRPVSGAATLEPAGAPAVHAKFSAIAATLHATALPLASTS